MSSTADFPALFGVWRADVPAFMRLPVVFLYYGRLRPLVTCVQVLPEEAVGNVTVKRNVSLSHLYCITIFKGNTRF